MMFFAITISIDVVDRNDRTHRSMAIDRVDPVASESISNKNAFDTFGLGKSDNAVYLSLQKSHAKSFGTAYDRNNEWHLIPRTRPRSA